jgi:hypothetical protein
MPCRRKAGNGTVSAGENRAAADINIRKMARPRKSMRQMRRKELPGMPQTEKAAGTVMQSADSVRSGQSVKTAENMRTAAGSRRLVRRTASAKSMRTATGRRVVIPPGTSAEAIRNMTGTAGISAAAGKSRSMTRKARAADPQMKTAG